MKQRSFESLAGKSEQLIWVRFAKFYCYFSVIINVLKVTPFNYTLTNLSLCYILEVHFEYLEPCRTLRLSFLRKRLTPLFVLK